MAVYPIAAKSSLLQLCSKHRPRAKARAILAVHGDHAEAAKTKANYLMVGKAGSSKTFLIEELVGKILNLPTALVDVTSYSETGSVDQYPPTTLIRLLHAAGQNPNTLHRVLCLDELDISNRSPLRSLALKRVES